MNGMQNLRLSLSFAIPSLLLAAGAFAHGHDDNDRNSRNKDDDARGRVIQKWNDRKGSIRPGRGRGAKFVKVALQCGAVVTVNTQMTQNLDCPNETGFAVMVVGDGITLDFANHTLTAPQAGAGIFVQGSNNTVMRARIQGVRPYGIFAYNSPGLQIVANDTSSNQVGIEVYTDSVLASNILIQGNVSRSNEAYGVRIGQGGSGTIVNPVITDNDFSNSGSFAMAIEAALYELDGRSMKNDYSNSEGGIFLVGGSFFIHHLSFPEYNLTKTQILATNAESVSLYSVDVSNRLAQISSGEHTGADLYRVGLFDLKFITSDNNDAGIRLQTEQGVSPTGNIQCSAFTNYYHAGVSVISYDGTPFGSIGFGGNFFDSKDVGTAGVMIEGSTQVDIAQILNSRCGSSRNKHCGYRDDSRDDNDDRRDDDNNDRIDRR